ALAVGVALILAALLFHMQKWRILVFEILTYMKVKLIDEATSLANSRFDTEPRFKTVKRLGETHMVFKHIQLRQRGHKIMGRRKTSVATVAPQFRRFGCCGLGSCSSGCLVPNNGQRSRNP